MVARRVGDCGSLAVVAESFLFDQSTVEFSPGFEITVAVASDGTVWAASDEGNTLIGITPEP